MSVSTTIESERSKTRARSIRDRMKDLGFDVGLQQAYEILAAADGHRNWATMKALQSRTSQPDTLSQALPLNDEPYGYTIPRPPVLLVGGTLHNRVGRVRKIAETLDLTVVQLELNESRLNGFNSTHQERMLDERKDPFLLYVEHEGKLHPEAEASMVSWVGHRRYPVIVGTTVLGNISAPLLAQFKAVCRQTKATPGLLPDTIRPRHSSLTLFGGRTQKNLDAHFEYYAQTFAEPNRAAVLGSTAFGKLLENSFPRGSALRHAVPAIEDSSGNSRFLSGSMRSDADPIWIQNAETCPFDETMTGTSLDTICLCFETGFAPAVGFVAASIDTFFRKVLSYCPGLKFHMSEDRYCIASDGRPNVRLVFEGRDLSVSFRQWIRTDSA